LPQKLSPHTVTKMMMLYFDGFSESAIAHKLKRDQSTVSLYVSKFKSLVEQQGLEAAGKELGIMDQVEELHSLAVELKAAKITVQEAKVGFKMVMVFQECGVKEDDYPDLVQACTKMKSEETAKAAVELNQLQNATGKTWKEIVAQGSSAHHELKQTQTEITSTVAKLKAYKEDFDNIQNQKKLADQDLKGHLKKVDAEKKLADQALASHMKQVGLNMNRLKLVEQLAITLKEASVSNMDLAQYIKRQEGLNEASISLDNFIAIVQKAKVITVDDGGKALADKLSQFGSLDTAIETQQNKLDLLAQETGGLEQKAKLKAEIETDITKLKAERAAHESVVAELAACEKKLAEVEHDVTDLLHKQAALLQDIKQKEEQLSQLDSEIAEKELKVSDLIELEAKCNAVSATLAELEAQKKLEVMEREIFESFLGIVASSLSLEAMEKFIATTPQLLVAAKEGGYSPELLRNVIVKELSGGTLEIRRCDFCQARSYVDKPARTFYTGHQCPSCGSSLVKTDVTGSEIIKKALAAPAPQVYVITPIRSPKGTDQKNSAQQEFHD